MTITRRCERCRVVFETLEEHYWYCPSCFEDIQRMGNTQARQRPAGAAHRHGGTWRTWDGRRISLDGTRTVPDIISGLEELLGGIYQRKMRLSRILKDHGFTKAQLKQLAEAQSLDQMIRRFCPNLRQYIIDELRMRSAVLLTDLYGLYGEEPYEMSDIADSLGIDMSHAQNLHRWALRELRQEQHRSAIEQILVQTAQSILDAKS